MRKLLAGLFWPSGVSSPLWAAHGYALWGDLKYPPGFSHFDYVNPMRPRVANCAW
jgi:microcin C transport system substrate-binding protein